MVSSFIAMFVVGVCLVFGAILTSACVLLGVIRSHNRCPSSACVFVGMINEKRVITIWRSRRDVVVLRCLRNDVVWG